MGVSVAFASPIGDGSVGSGPVDVGVMSKLSSSTLIPFSSIPVIDGQPALVKPLLHRLLWGWADGSVAAISNTGFSSLSSGCPARPVWDV